MKSKEVQTLDCVFCHIVANAKAASRVYQDDLCTAFMAIHPINKGHMLVVPNEHVSRFGDLNEQTVSRLLLVGQRLSVGLHHSGIKCEGVNLYMSDRDRNFDRISHFHIHLYPRFKDDGFCLIFGPSYFERQLNRSLDEAAGMIRRGLENSFELMK